MDKISVLIPTIQKNEKVLTKLLKILKKDKVVSEILIINNAIKNFEKIIPDEKVKIYTPNENYYVNYAWNIGVKLLENEKFLIINDDILCCENFCSLILETGILDKETTGLVGLNPASIAQNSRETVKDISVPKIDKHFKLFLEPMSNYMMTGDWGSAYFGKKQNYYSIPVDLKIIYGDNYLLYKNLQNGKTNYKISGLPFNHIHSLSSASPEFSAVIASDIKNSKKYFN